MRVISNTFTQKQKVGTMNHTQNVMISSLPIRPCDSSSDCSDLSYPASAAYGTLASPFYIFDFFFKLISHCYQFFIAARSAEMILSQVLDTMHHILLLLPSERVFQQNFNVIPFWNVISWRIPSPFPLTTLVPQRRRLQVKR